MDTEFFVPLIVMGSIAFIIKVISDNSLRRYLAKEGQINESLKYLYADRAEARVPSSLKWGMVLLALGAAILVGKLVNTFARTDDLFMVALMLMFGGGALIAYYVIARRLIQKQQETL